MGESKALVQPHCRGTIERNQTGGDLANHHEAGGKPGRDSEKGECLAACPCNLTLAVQAGAGATGPEAQGCRRHRE